MRFCERNGFWAASFSGLYQVTQQASSYALTPFNIKLMCLFKYQNFQCHYSQCDLSKTYCILPVIVS